MYIEFSLPHDWAAQSVLHANRIITLALHDWSDRYNIPYNVKNIKYIKRVTFDDDRYYTLFALTWNPGFRTNYRVIRDLNNKI
jgi:hypothetical protein